MRIFFLPVRVHRRAALAALLLLCVNACGPAVVRPSPVINLRPGVLDTDVEPYRIGAGDELEIKFFFAPELNQTAQVRPDGKISLMFAQDVKAAGKTPEELAKLLRRKFKSHVRQPELVVIMHGFGSQKVYVGGEVVKPGPVILSGRESLLQVLDEAGWMLPTARKDEVVLVRRDEDGVEEVYPLNIARMVSGEDMTHDILIAPGDLILVPPSDSVAVDRWVDRNVRQTLPVPGGIVINRGVGP